MTHSDILKTPFIEWRSDFGFKRMFGTQANQRILVRFLNALFSDEFTVTKVEFHDKEILPKSEAGKRIIYDIYCQAKPESFRASRINEDHFPTIMSEDSEVKDYTHHFILEMQNEYSVPFEDRVLMYSSRLVADQLKRGSDYRLQPVISIAITNFRFPHLNDAPVHDMVMSDRNTGEVLTEKMRVVLLSLETLNGKSWKDLTTELEKFLYLIKNMGKMDTNSEAYKSGEYKEIFESAETGLLAAEDYELYSASAEAVREHEAAVAYAANKGKAEGRAEGWAEGRAEGRAEGEAQGLAKGIIKVVRNMLNFGMPKDQVAAINNMTVAELNTLLGQE